MLIDRPTPIDRIHQALSDHPVAALTGPRQCGKTTLAREIAARAEQATYFDLEEPPHRRRLATPEQALGRLRGLVVIDGVQRSSMLLATIRILVDRTGNAARFLLVGSAAHSWNKRVSEYLAGRVGLVELGGLHLGEVSPADWRRLWLRGGFPRSYLASPDGSVSWRRNWRRSTRPTPVSGEHTAAWSWRCSSVTGERVSASSASSRMHPSRPAGCGRRFAIWRSITCGSCIRGRRSIVWMTGYPCSPSRMLGTRRGN